MLQRTFIIVKSSAISGEVNLDGCCIVKVCKKKRLVDSLQSMVAMHRWLCNKEISLYISSFSEIGDVAWECHR